MKNLKFNAIRHVESYYVTEIKAGKVTIYPFDNYTIAEYKNSSYVLPYGLTTYKLFNEHHDQAKDLLPSGIRLVDSKFAPHIPAVIIKDVTKYINSSKENSKLIGLDTILSSFFKDSEPNRILTDKEYQELINSALDIMKVSDEVTDNQVKDLYQLGTDNTEEASQVITQVLLQLISQLNSSGLLDSLTDIPKMMKESLK